MTSAVHTPHHPEGPGLVALTIATIAALAILVGLGVWQMQRLAWKTALLATIAERTTAAPAPLPPEADWAGLKPDDYAYRHVAVDGVFEHDQEVRVFRPLATARGPYSGLGYLVLTPLQLPSGATVIVNRGFVPEARADPATRAGGQVQGPVAVTGLMREPEQRNSFTPADDPKQRLWFTRDPQSIAAAFGLSRVAPFTIDADASKLPGGLPEGGETVLAIPNDHLSYALTWFGLAFGLLVVYAAYVWRVRHRAPP